MRILVIEDEHRIAQAIKKGLEQENFTVDLAHSGSLGYDLAISETYDLIILDRMLPEIDGITICQNLRKEQNHTPILMLTAKGQVEDKVNGLNAGADDYLTKPFSFEELVARVKTILRRPAQIKPEVLKVGNLLLDTKKFEILRNGEKIILSQKEYLLLLYLMKNQNQIVSKEQIISHVWSYDANILPNTIEVYIKNLRGKIDVPFAKDKPLIQTIRGFGYKIA